MVKTAEQFAAKATQWLLTPHQATVVGLAARNAILPHRGAAEKHAAVVSSLIG